MCHFKSGIILKTKCFISENEDNSHTLLLEKLGIEDTETQAMTRFVRAELLPPNDEWWTDPTKWIFHVDQDILPDWYTKDPEKYEKSFREEVESWVNKHVLVEKDVDVLFDGYYMLKECNVDKLTNSVDVFLQDSVVQEMFGSSHVIEMYGKSSVKKMHNYSSILNMYDNSSVDEMNDESSICEAYDYSAVHTMTDDSVVRVLRGRSSVDEMHGHSAVRKMWDYAVIHKMCDNSVAQELGIYTSVKKVYDDAKVTDSKWKTSKMVKVSAYEHR